MIKENESKVFEFAPEVEEIGKVLVGQYHHHLEKAKISYVFRDKAMRYGDGRTVLGRASSRNKLDKLLSEKREDFVVIISKDRWEKMIDVEKRALVDHELCHCFPSPKTGVYTVDGWKPISNVKIGDYVLTHNGNFKKVQKRFVRWFHDQEMVEINLDLKRKNSLVLTKGHPVLTENGWKEAFQLSKNDSIYLLANNCSNCNELIPFYRKLCENCENANRSKNGTNIWKDESIRDKIIKAVILSNKRRDLTNFIKAGHQKTKELIDSGLHPFATGEAIKKSLSISGKRKRSFLERKLGWWLKNNLKEKIIPQFPILKGKMKHNNAKRYYFLDFAIPKHKIAIEVDGYFHKGLEESDKIRQNFIEKRGWKFLRFSEDDIKNKLEESGLKIKRVIMNDSKQFKFLKIGIKELKFRKLKSGCLYNLSVEDDDSFVAKGIVVHNCGIAIDAQGNSKFALRGHPIEEFPENLARFEHRRERIGNLIKEPPSAIAIKQPERLIETEEEEKPKPKLNPKEEE